MLIHFLRRLPPAVCGITYAISNDFGFRTQFYVGGLFSVFILYTFSPLSIEEFLFLATAAMLVLITELQNSALEHALDQIHPEKHEGIRRSKDMAAGAVLLAASYSLLVLGLLLARRFIL